MADILGRSDLEVEYKGVRAEPWVCPVLNKS